MKTLNRSLFVVLAAALLGMINACGLHKEKPEVDHGSAPSESNRVVGTVRSTDDCGFYIEYIQGDVAHSLYPTNLDAKFQVDGMRLKFAYEATKAKVPENCPNFEPVTVSDLTPLR
ncbi:MAG TPA: hypothetical protein VK151_03405 [Fluviicola sp.]|nr:hypothetical protein [Fluviicola sp.]